jgi:hypothetical protein
MTTEPNPTEQEHRKPKAIRQSGASEAVYGLGLIGACVYYFGHAATFWLGVLGFFKAIVWPAMLVYEALKFLNM